jgi:RNA polymerase sigma factor (sigma-70 family)
MSTESGVEDQQLVESVRGGSIDAYGELVRRHQSAVLSLAWSLLGDFADAQDLAQETFIRALRNLDMLADPTRFGPWIRRIAFGTCIDWLRTFRPHFYQSANGTADALALLPASEPNPLEQLEQLEIRERVLAAVASLPPRYRAPLTLFHLDGLSHDKVAAALGVSTGTARSLVTRARQRLLPLLAALGESSPGLAPADDVFAEQTGTRRLLHIVNGDATAHPLRQSAVPGTIAVWADVLHDGPVPAETGTDAWRRTRAQFIAQSGWISQAEAERTYADWDAALDSAPSFDEVILWLEHDLFDQLLLIHHLDAFSRRPLSPARLSLICIGDYPGIEPFHGLGQLSPDQLASLIDTRQTVTARQLELGHKAWRAFTGNDPRQIDALRGAVGNALPFLPGALHRLLEEFPSTVNGLPRTERQILTLLQQGSVPFDGLFTACQKLEERVYMGDSSFALRLRELSTAKHPLVSFDRELSPRGPFKASASITPAGRAVLAGTDAAQLNGIDRWIGGVHLQGNRPSWRWDPLSDRVVPG